MNNELLLQELGTFHFDQNQRIQFRSGELSREWKRKYPNSFDEDDLRLALSQPKNHFFEWLGAVVINQKYGFLSLVEQYQFKKHKHKQEILGQLNFPGLQKGMEYQRRINRVQAPDLLVYAPDYSDWFFCEVKGGFDYLRQTQKDHFLALSQLSGKPIYQVNFKTRIIS